MKVAEARELETELQRMKEENAELRKRLNETSVLESAKKKAEARAEQLEQRVSHIMLDYCAMLTCLLDGRDDSGEGHAKRKRTERDV